MTYSRRGLWSLRSLADHILGELSGSRDAQGNAPERLLNLTAEALRDIWEDRPWVWQRKQATLNVSAGDTEEAFEDDFRELDSLWLQDRERTLGSEETDYGLVFTTDLSLFQEVSARYDPNDTQEPVIACVIQDATETDFMKY